jgi:hypothetical protein
MSVTVIVPTRGRPNSGFRLLQSFKDTAVLTDTSLLFALDADDPEAPNYPQGARHTLSRGDMVQRSNAAVRLAAGDIIGWAADDNLFVTPGWDEAVTESFSDPGVGMVNTNDLLVGDEKGGSFFIRRTCVEALGYLLLPTCEHLYVDFAASELFKAAGAYVYRDDIVIEHLHPYANKASWDAGYTSVNNYLQDDRDRRAFYLWRDGIGFRDDIQKVKACLSS